MSLSHIQYNLRHFRLYRIQERLETALEEAAKNSVSYTDFLDEILSQEVASKQEKYIAVRTSLAKFPYVKTLESFDEFSLRKGHVYMTSFGDLEASGVIWDPYLNGIGKFLNKAKVVFDRFHVMNQLNEAIERVRWEEQRDNKALKKSRFLWLKNPKNLTCQQEARLGALKKLDLHTARAYHIELTLARFWEIPDPVEAMSYLKRWYFGRRTAGLSL